MHTGNIIPFFMRYWGKASPGDTQAGNPYHPLPFHSLDVAAVGYCLLKKHPHLLGFFATSWGISQTDTLKLITYLLAVHDLGKFSIHFQRKAPDIHTLLQPDRPAPLNYDPTRHDQMGYCLMVENRSAWSRDLFGPRDRLPRFLAGDLHPLFAATLCHHGRMPQGTTELGELNFPKKDREAAFSFAKAAAKLFGLPIAAWPRSEQQRHQFQTTSFPFAGFAILCDWLGSNQEYFTYDTRPITLADYWQNQALVRAKTALAATDLQPPVVKTGGGMHTFFPNYVPTPLQKYAHDLRPERKPQLFIVEDLTGSGKTEAALLIAYRLMEAQSARGMFVALPTMATADQMFERVAKAYGQFFDGATSCILAHGQRHLSHAFKSILGLEHPPGERDLQGQEHENASATCNNWLSDSLKKCLLANVGVGTVDQVMLAAMYAKHSALRLYGLLGKVLILDEIHAYDVYMLTILKRLLAFHASMGGSAVLLSATLPLDMRDQLCAAFRQGWGELRSAHSEIRQAYPALTHLTRDAAYITHKPLEIPHDSERQIHIKFLHEHPLQRIQNWAQAGKCICWIRNTVMDAVEAYHALIQQVDPKRVTLFHARFPMGSRLEIQQELLQRFGPKSTSEQRHGRIVIATQVVEQSLDVDFDRVVSDLAPIDLLIQRLGRQMRHPRSTEGNPLERHEPDQRGSNEFHVFAPPFDAQPAASWYRDFLPRANRVYKATDALWLTMQTLVNKPVFSLPGDTRHLIEGVYAAEMVPEAFHDLNMDQLGQKYADQSQAVNQVVDFDFGYDKGAKTSEHEDQVRTRLGLPTVILKLAMWEEQQFLPLPAANGIWEQSQVRVSTYFGIRMAPLSESRQMAFDALCESLPDKNKRVLFVPMTQKGDAWLGETCDEKDQTVQIIFHPNYGVLRLSDFPA